MNKKVVSSVSGKSQWQKTPQKNQTNPKNQNHKLNFLHTSLGAFSEFLLAFITRNIPLAGYSHVSSHLSRKSVSVIRLLPNEQTLKSEANNFACAGSVGLVSEHPPAFPSSLHRVQL